MKYLRFDLKAGTMLSLFVHMAIGGILYLWAFGYLKHNSLTIITELDMTAVTPAQIAGRIVKPEPPWLISRKKIQPLPPKLPEKEVPKPPEADDAGDYIPAAMTAHKPRWVGNFITPDDYPVVARQEGNDGRVIVQVRIDAEGKVRDVKLLQGSSQVLNEVAVRKVRNAIFTPAYNAQNLPVACEVILPIKFQLK
jgi:protein TonB